MMKMCKKCLIEKNTSLFYRAKNTKDGLRSACIECMKHYNYENKETITNRVKTYTINNKLKVKEYQKEYYKLNKNRIKEYSKTYYSKNTKEISEKNKCYREKNIDKIKKYRIINKNEIKELKKKYNKDRKRNDALYKLTCNIRTLISKSIRQFGFSKKSKTSKILCCSFNDFKIHIEKQFDNKMTWNNYGIYWQIDHIYPVSKCLNEEHLLLLNHYTNLRPLEASENNKKNNKIL